MWETCVDRRPDMPRYLEKRRRRWYATLDIPKDLRQEAFNGKPRFVKSLETESLAVAERRVGVLISGWKSEIEAARRTGSLDPLEADIEWYRRHLPQMSHDQRESELEVYLQLPTGSTSGSPYSLFPWGVGIWGWVEPTGCCLPTANLHGLPTVHLQPFRYPCRSP